MPLSPEHIRRYVLHRATKWLGKSVHIYPDFREPEIRQFRVAGPVENHIVGFKVSVNNVLAVEVFEAKEDLGKK